LSEAFQFARITTIDAVLEAFDWPFAREQAAGIEALWQRETAKVPALFNGEVLIQHRGTVEGTVFRAGYSITRYKAFLAWNRLGCPGLPVRNGFAMAALQARDGAYLLGVMAAHTANAGKIYFAAGTPDRGDLTADGRVDLAGSVMRELTEETGLGPADVTLDTDWLAVIGASRAAFMRHVRIDLPADEARALILARMAHLPEQELADIHIARGPADIDPAHMPPFQCAFLAHAFAQRG
jgi:8-oxo-dGTP pyrophosphatase MutT (NUDIX family)